jgi:heptosyltransferase III
VIVPGTTVLHPGALGDVLLAVPALRALRAGARGHELVLAAQGRIGALLTALGVVDRALDFDGLGLHALFTADAPGERARALLAGARVVSWFASRDTGFTGRVRSLASESVIAPSRPDPPGLVWEHLLASVAAFSPAGGGEAAWRGPVALGDALVGAGRQALAAAGWDGAGPLVILHPGAGGVTKRWDADGYAALAAAAVDAFDGRVVLHEGPADGEAVAALRRRLRVRASVLANPPLGTLAGALAHAALWIGNDSGVSHLAAAVGAPTLALFTAENLAWRPWAPGARVHVVDADALARADVDAVIAAAAERLDGAKAVGLGRGAR